LEPHAGLGLSRPLAGRVVLVTGGTSGIGRATAVALAGLGATTYVASRSEERARSAAEAIARTSGNPEVHGLGADLARIAGARALAERVLTISPRLDVLVNNAGGLFSQRQVSDEGHERTWALNVLAPFQLTARLAPALRATAPARVVNVSSTAHRSGRIALDDLEGATRYSGWRAYCQSKLALLLLTYAWAGRLAGTGITVNAAHPGFVRTGFGRNNPGATGLGFRIAEALFAIGPERAARTIVTLASAPELAQTTGGYFARSRPRRSSAASYDPAMGERLWTICAGQTGVEARPPGGSGPTLAS
jgi:NAD(P)-dependent dehydrogenase (short-subunit alcohol dehydrogenase family)